MGIQTEGSCGMRLPYPRVQTMSSRGERFRLRTSAAELVGGEGMSELAYTAFHFCSKAKKKGLKKYEVLWLVEGQLDTLESIKVQKHLSEESIRRGD